jgi:dihydrofolate reductase
MRIRTYMAVSVDGFVSGPDGMPAQLLMPDFNPAVSHGFPEFLKDVDAVVMGRTTFDPALNAPHWPWAGHNVYVLSSRPMPTDTPEPVVADSDPPRLLEQMRAAGNRDVHLVGGVSTLHAFRELGAIDRFELLILPIQLGTGVPLSAPGTELTRLRLEQHEAFPDGVVHVAYTFS